MKFSTLLRPTDDAKGSAARALGKVAKGGQELPKEALDRLIAVLNDPQADDYAKEICC